MAMITPLAVQSWFVATAVLALLVVADCAVVSMAVVLLYTAYIA